MRTSRPIAFAGFLSVAAVLGSACSESQVAGGTGNDVIDDTRPQPRPPANPDPPTNDASSDANDASTYGDAAARATCGDCACTPDAHYCFGGASPRGLDPVSPAVADAGDASGDDGGDAGPAACPLPPDASTVQAGCNDLPTECAAAPTCDCILNALQPKYSCYLVCHVPGPQFLVYCPSP